MQTLTMNQLWGRYIRLREAKDTTAHALGSALASEAAGQGMPSGLHFTPSLSPATSLPWLTRWLAYLGMNLSLKTTCSLELCNINWVLLVAPGEAPPLVFFPCRAAARALGGGGRSCILSSRPRTVQLGHPLSALSPHQDQWLLLPMETCPTPWSCV